MRQPGITILISTYNGSKKLPATIHAFTNLKTEGIPAVECIIVDNNSNDGTYKTAQKLWEEYAVPFPLKLLSEPTPGKQHAQELGMAHASYKYVITCDDDNSLYPDFLQVGYRMLEENPIIGVLGARGLPVSTVPIPDWFPAYAYHFACAPQAPATGSVHPVRNVVYGAGMWVRMDAYDLAKSLGFKLVLQSRTGKSLASGGEDSELCWALIFLGYEVWYADELRFEHHIPTERLTNDYLERLIDGIGLNGPLSRIHLRIGKGEIRKPVHLFWLKESVYTLWDFITSFFNSKYEKPAEARKVFRRNLHYFLKLRSRYDQLVNRTLDYYMKSAPYREQKK